MSSLNRGLFSDDLNLNRRVMEATLKECFLKYEGIEDVIFLTDEEIINISDSLTRVVKKSLSKYQNNVLPEEDIDDKELYTDPEFLKKFNESLVININHDSSRLAKYILVDRTHARNVTDYELLQSFGKICSQVAANIQLHIPSNNEKLSQIECFYDAATNSIKVEKLGAGAPSVIMNICRNLTAEQQQALIDAGKPASDKSIKTLTFPYGSIAEMYDEMLAFLLEEESYDAIYIAISNSKDDVPIPTEVKSLHELYSALSIMQKQIAPYGIMESQLITM